jgi:hypothetical protein
MELIYPGIIRTRKDAGMWESENLLKGAVLRRGSHKYGITDAWRNSKKEILSDFKPIQ